MAFQQKKSPIVAVEYHPVQKLLSQVMLWLSTTRDCVIHFTLVYANSVLISFLVVCYSHGRGWCHCTYCRFPQATI